MKEIGAVFDDVAARAAQAIPINAGDYEKDGLYICGQCHTPKECVITNPFSGKMRKVRCMCQCEQEKYKREQAEEAEKQRRIRIKQMKATGLHDRSLENCTFANDTGINRNIILAEKFVARWDEMRAENACLIFYGGVGCGKSYAAACIANALLDRGFPVLMATSSRLIDQAMSFKADYDFTREMAEFDLVIIDDFGAERTTEYALQKLFDIIDARVKQGKPMILTTNLTPEQMKSPSDLTYSRIFSRVMGACIPIRFSGGDLRQQIGKDKAQKIKELFL